MARRRKGNPINGWVNFDKPLGMTSTQAVGKIRWMFQAQKAGHAGTLDPLASGILPIALGEATKTIPFMTDAEKAYRFTVRWGEITDTLDAEGEVIETSSVRPNVDEINNVLPQFTGEISQIPPKYSAIKVDGQRAYDLARGGAEVELKARPVKVHALKLIESETDQATFDVRCGKGTYVRSLARDISSALGTVGHVVFLRRTQVGSFTENTAFSLDAMDNLCHRGRVLEALGPIDAVLDDIPVLALTRTQAIDLKHGRAIALPDSLFSKDATDESLTVLAKEDGQAVALCDVKGEQVLPRRVFNL